MFKYILLDLDGTLLDTCEGIKNSVRYALEAFGKPVPAESEMKRYFGPPLCESFAEFDGFEGEEVEAAVKKFRERYEKIGVTEYGFFEDLPKSLEALKNAGCTLAVATSKPEHTARYILKHAGVDGFFDYIGGADDTANRKKKADVISYVIERLGITDKSLVLMVGDRLHDVEGAHENGIKCVGLLCGYGSREELEACGADYIAEHISDIAGLLEKE